ncbi:MAG: ROK family transcriptional regulator [Anaerolineaceae bacterium]|jgi:N-acetylglucosamine repressor
MEKATRQHTREHNQNLVFKTIITHDQISRAEISRKTRLTRTTVSGIVADLISHGLVEEVGLGPSVGGKNPILLRLVEDSRLMIGIDISHNQFRGATVNLRGKIKDRIEISLLDEDGDEALQTVYRIIDYLFSKTNQSILGIGIGTPGLVNTHEGRIINAVNLDWQDLPLVELLEDRYGVPVYVLNDSQAAAIGEKTYGDGFDHVDNLVVINVRHGIGAGIVINGSLFQGDGGSAGEIGHWVVIQENGDLCRCGKYGCLETVASTQAILRKAKNKIASNPDSKLAQGSSVVDLKKIKYAFEQNDPLACELVYETAKYLGRAIAYLVSTLNINQIVLVGDMTSFGEKWLKEIQRSMLHYSLSKPMSDTQVHLSHSGEDIVILGVTALLANNFSLLFKS